MSRPTIQITSHYASSDLENGVNIVSSITHLLDSYFIWVGGTTETPVSVSSSSTLTDGLLSDDEINKPFQEADAKAVQSLVAQVMQGGLVAQDWACAMPSRQPGSPALGTFVFRSANSDESLAISQRLARRLQKQVSLSLEVPAVIRSSGQTSLFLLQVEKHLLGILKSFNVSP